MCLIVRVAILIPCWTLCLHPVLAQTSTPDFLFDHNGDGAIDSQDLLLLLQRWGLRGIETPTPSPTVTPSASPTPSQTSLPVETATFTPSPSASPTETPTPTSTETPTDTATQAPTETPTVTDTPSPSETPTNPNSFTADLVFPTPFPLRMIRIPAGSFMMGSPDTERSRETDEGPVHQVTIANDFFMGQTEVTQAQWEVVMGFPPDLRFGEGDNHPVYLVSWLECQDFLVALNALSGEGTFRLPSEAEWEYACRAGTTKRFYFGNSLGCEDGLASCEDCEVEEEVIGGGKSLPWESPLGFEPKLPLPFNLMRSDFMWFCANSDILSQRVRSLRPNAFGLYDMAGNVFEWVQDEYHSDYTGAPTDGSAWVADGNGNRVIRGGAFESAARSCRSANRSQLNPSSSSFIGLGFRIVWTP